MNKLEGSDRTESAVPNIELNTARSGRWAAAALHRDASHVIKPAVRLLATRRRAWAESPATADA